MSGDVLLVEFERPITEAALVAWLVRAAPGERIVYWRGFLAVDRWSPRRDRHRLCSVARLAWGMAEKGWVHLVQQRVAPGVFDYIAIARPRKLPRPRFAPAIHRLQEAA